MEEFILKKMELTIPIVKDGVAIKQIDIPYPRGKDLRFLPTNMSGDVKVEAFYPMMTSMLGITEDAIDMMAANDILAFVELISDFFQKTTLFKQ